MFKFKRKIDSTGVGKGLKLKKGKRERKPKKNREKKRFHLKKTTFKRNTDSSGMKFEFKNWKIRNKIFIGFIVIILSLIFITATAYNFIGRIVKDYIPIIEAQTVIASSVQEMNVTQRDFVIIDRSNEEFFKAAQTLQEGQLSPTERSLEFGEHYNNVLKTIDELRKTSLIKNDEDLIDQLYKLEGKLSVYRQTFNEMHLNIQKRGFGEYGLIGEIETLRKLLKNKLVSLPQDENLVKALANLDIAHINYLYTQEARYQKQIADRLGYPNTQVALGDYTQKFKDEYREIATGYTDRFLELVEIDNVIGRNESEGLFAKIGTLSAEATDMADIFNDSIKQRLEDQIAGTMMMLLLTVAIITLVAIGFAVILSNIISKPLTNVNKMLSGISDGEGDLTKELKINTREEIGTLAKLFNQFVMKIRNVVIQVKASAASLTNYTDEIHEAIEQANESIEQVNFEVRNMVDGLQNSASVVEQTTAGIQELSSSAQMISKEADAVASDSKQVLSASKNGVEKLSKVVNSIEQVKNSTESMAGVIGALKLSSEEIVGIVNMINAIAEQTSLLALNASIEAARAGEHGRGFSVVAEEVRKLAEQSKGSAFKINDIIDQISKDIKGASETMIKEQTLVDISVSEANDTSVSFNQILSLIEAIAVKMTNISHGAQQQSMISEEMAKAIDELSHVMQGNVASSERIGESVESQVATFEEIAASITELKNMAGLLETETNRFKVV